MAVIVVETLALGLAAWNSSSAALFALTAQSVAGLVVEGLLLVGSLRSGRPADDRHPLGYGREAYFWSLFAALAIFVGGGALALGEAWCTLGEESGQGTYSIEYAVLVGVLIANVWSLRAVVGPVGRSRIRSYAGELRRTSDPIVVTVVVDNATSVAGTVLALLGLALHQATGAPVFDAWPAPASVSSSSWSRPPCWRGDVSSSLVARSRRRRSIRSSRLLRPPRASTRSSTSRQSSPARARSS